MKTWKDKNRKYWDSLPREKQMEIELSLDSNPLFSAYFAIYPIPNHPLRTLVCHGETLDWAKENLIKKIRYREWDDLGGWTLWKHINIKEGGYNPDLIQIWHSSDFYSTRLI